MSCQLRKHVVWSHASVMICVSSNDLSCRLETSSLDRQGLCVRFRTIPRRDTPQGEVKLVCLWRCHVSCGTCFVLAHRLTGKLFSPRTRRRQLVFAGVGTPCVLTKCFAPTDICFFVSILGSAHAVLPLVVLVNVGCNTGEQQVSTVVPGSLKW